MPALKGKKGIRAYLLGNVGKIVTTEQIREASSGQGQYGRRLRKLRDEEGWPIQSHNDAAELKSGEYRLDTYPPPQFARNISGKLRASEADQREILKWLTAKSHRQSG